MVLVSEAKLGKGVLRLWEYSIDPAELEASLTPRMKIIGTRKPGTYLLDMGDNLIALFELEQTDEGIKIVAERHYRLVPPDDVYDVPIKSDNRTAKNKV